MATQKPISTISYNSEKFLKEKLETWLSGHIIQAYQYIKHKGEDGDKDHIHLRIEPNKKLDPMDLLEQLREFTDQNGKPISKPLGCRPFRPSKEEDWILYAEHDAQYLKLKYGGGEKGEKLPYSWKDIVVPEYYDMETAHIRAKAYLEHSTVNIATRMQKGESSIDLLLQGENPYIVNAIGRALFSNDYERLSSECSNLQKQLNDLLFAIDKAGFIVESDENGNPVLTKFVPVSDNDDVPFT